MTITVLYTCAGCGLHDRPVEVPARREDEDVVHWTKETLGWAIKRDHELVSPRCSSTVLETVKVPVGDGNVRIGDPVRRAAP